MKRMINFLLGLAFFLTFTGCSGNFAQINLEEPIAIAEDGMVEKGVLDKVKTDNAIATFTGTDHGIEYEWTVFGSDLAETKDVNLALVLEETDKGLEIKFKQKEDFGFPALLSVHLNEKWVADSATAYDGERAVFSVSITGSKNSILNISVSSIVEECIILPDENLYADNTSVQEQEPVPDEKNNNENLVAVNTEDDYLSAVGEDDNKVYSGTTGSTQTGPVSNQNDNYLSGVNSGDNRVYSDGKSTNQDQYKTDPVPEGKPMPVEPENQEINNAKTYTCTFSIECSTILNNLEQLNPNKRELIPSNGVILAATKVTFYEGESVYDVLQRVCKENNIHMEASWTPVYNSAYIEGIHNLYEFDCGPLSGWMYRVNGWYPNYGCSRYQLADGEVVEWRYTCDLGKDVGCDWME